MKIYTEIIFKNLPDTASLLRRFLEESDNDIRIFDVKQLSAKDLSLKIEFDISNFDKMQVFLNEVILYATKNKYVWTKPIKVV